MPISCHFRDCKALLVTNLTHVSSAITCVQIFTFIFCYVIVKLINNIEFRHITKMVSNMLLTPSEQQQSRYYYSLFVFATTESM